MCEHNDIEALGYFPENMYVDGECLANKIKCLECGKKMNDILYCNHRHMDIDNTMCIDCFQNIKEKMWV